MNPIKNEEYSASWQNAPPLQYNLWQDSQYLDHHTPGNIFTNVGDSSYFTGESHNIQKDEKNRRIITRQMLYGGQRRRMGEALKPDWAPVNFCKSTDNTYVSTTTSPMRCLKKNSIEKRLDEAMVQTVKMSKAEIMMQKMGWQGGALGKDGDGITVPVVPNAAYATTTLGLGNSSQYLGTLPASPAKVKKQIAKTNRHSSHQPLENSDVFLTNALKIILDFLKNDFELELVFEKDLFSKERKAIHELVQKFGSDDLEKYNLDTVEQMDLVAEIERCNMFVLGTQSEGIYPHRKLSLYKEAPLNMYLVTPHDLKHVDEDSEICDDLETAHDTDNAQSTNAKSKGDEITEAKSAKHDKATDNQIADENFYKIDDKNDAIAGDQTKHIGNKDISDSNSLDTDESNPFLLSITKNLRTPKVTNQECALKDKYNAKIPLYKSNNNETKVVFDVKTNNQMTDDVDIETAKESVATGIVDVRQTIIEFFVEFCDNRKYNQFRFVGPFSEGELSAIYTFFEDVDNILSCTIPSKRIKGNEKIAECCSKISLEIKQDCNGHSAIYKRM